LHDFANKWLPQCKIDVDISRQQFVPMSGLQNNYLTLKNEFLKVLIVQKVQIFNQLVLTSKVPNL